ncbi:hypothetical protein ACQVQT_17175 [Bacillus paranthracis]|uniref:Lipoprotein n=4 Tax=Bacillus cereus group TaxID=86661 RepID=A0A5M9GY83_9BACI|nr:MULTISPECIES: hypothetical protein [Bacillus]ACJ77477.1 putative lipoprotein [Bacillus cereus AH187]ACM11562.1 conserved hypothetical protein [Bacillus cereus Q1]EDZ56630.1 lipoprotein, putative [Bacillus cereus H3081.97]EEL01745.1 hypothetical protein bcere0013_9800 [Bacillus cereus BDRD-ST26]EJP95744.1 hypothetical protein IAU_02414 [Bacillus cereus IS075]EJQ10968.1 hypothetical protein IC5_00213 [Bacillus cereus AND1407]EJR12247.1 hypothetical protein II7_03128 [Bacillus cereus MSX-A12
MKKLLMVIGLTFLMLAGCSNGNFDKVMDEGKTALTNKEYKNALSSFEKALDEKKDDSDAKVLVEQTKAMIEAVKLKEETKVEESIKSFEKVENMKDGNSTLVKQAKEERTALLAIVEQKKKYSEQLVKSEELINKKNYAEAKDILNKLVSETKDNKNLEEYNKKASGLITKIGEAEKNATVAKAEKTNVATNQKVTTEKPQKVEAEKNQKVTAEKTQKVETEKNQKVTTEKNQKVETGKTQDAFTFEKAKEYIKNEYKEDYDYTLENTQVENGKKYYQIRVRTTYKIEGAAGSGFTGVFKVFEDGTIVEVH